MYETIATFIQTIMDLESNLVSAQFNQRTQDALAQDTLSSFLT